MSRIFEAAKKRKDIDIFINTLRKKLELILPNHAIRFSREIVNILVKKILQMGHLSVTPDIKVDLNNLISNALHGLTSIVNTFSADLPVSQYVETLSSPLYPKSGCGMASDSVQKEQLHQLLVSFLKSTTSKTEITSLSLIEFHNNLKRYCSILKKERKPIEMVTALL